MSMLDELRAERDELRRLRRSTSRTLHPFELERLRWLEGEVARVEFRCRAQ